MIYCSIKLFQKVDFNCLDCYKFAYNMCPGYVN